MASTTVRQTLRGGDLERALGEDTWCVKKYTVMTESMVATFTVLYRTSPTLLTFNILRFLYENPVFWLMADYEDCILVHKTTEFI